jgi:ApaG protein
MGSLELPGLIVTVEKLVHIRNPEFTGDLAHTFVYHLAIANFSDRTVTLLGRKWILRRPGGPTDIIEGDGIVGETPTLKMGDVFRYHSQHLSPGDKVYASGAFHGHDAQGQAIHTCIPEFLMEPPLI